MEQKNQQIGQPSPSSVNNQGKKFKAENYPEEDETENIQHSHSYMPKRSFKDDQYQDMNVDPLRALVRQPNDQVAGNKQGRSATAMIVPSHRSQKRPVSILKNKRNQVGRFVRNTNQFWDYYGGENAGESSNEDTNQPKNAGQKTIAETNFFECREVTNCEFIYEQSEKNPNRGGLLDSIQRLISRSDQQVEISAMTAIKDLLVIGFSNGVLILFDIDKLEITYQNKNFTKNDKPIDKLKLFQYENSSIDDTLTLLLSLSDGLLSYHIFPKITLVDELIMERDIIDFQPYQINRRPFLASVHKSKDIKIFRLRKRMNYMFVTKFHLEQIPQAFIAHRDIFVISYKTHAEYIKVESKGKEQEAITRINLWQNNEHEQKYAPLPVFDESIQAFIITKEDYSFYMDLKGIYDREFNKIKWSDHVMNVEVVRPYLVGFLPNSIEIKNIFNPNRVVQKIELLQSTICKYTIALNHINLKELDSTYILLNRKQSNIKVLLKMTQIDPRVQINMLIERKLYSTGLKFCDFLLENNFEGLTREQYDKLQREKGFYNFIVKRRYTIAKEIFKEYKVPLQHVILLFSEVYPQPFIKNLAQMFDIKIKEIPYLDVQKPKELYQANISGQRNNQYSGYQDLNYLKNEIDSDKLAAMKEFLTYFLKKRSEIIKRIEQLSLNEKHQDYQFQPIQYGGPIEERHTFNPDMMNGQFFQQFQQPTASMPVQKQPSRKRSFEGMQPGDQIDNPFDLPVIPEKLHQSDNENVNAKISQMLYLRIMTEIFLFHSLIILIKSDEEKDKIILKNEFYQLIKNDNILPNDFCKEVFFSYSMYDEALQFLFYKKEYNELLSLIQKEYEKNKQDKETQKYWIQKFIKYCKKINELGNEDFIIGHTDWIFKVDTQIGLECVKKFSKQDPFKSEKVLRHIKSSGGARACFRYLEYLTLECEITDRVIHTELACLIVEQINYVLINYMIKAPGSDDNMAQLDIEKANEDQYIFGLRKKLLNFLQTSDYFMPQVILEIMPPNYLLKERTLLLTNQRMYKEAFAIAVDQVCDAEFAMQVAHRAFKWHKDKSVYFHLFVKLLQVGERDQAMQVLKSNFHFIPFDKVSQFLKDEEIFDINLSQFYQRSFIEMEKVSKELKVLKGLTHFEYLKAADALNSVKSEYFQITDDTTCSKCQKKISSYPFYYLPKSKDLVHYYCYNNQQQQQIELSQQKEQEANAVPPVAMEVK